MIYAFIFHIFVVDPTGVCHNCASATFCDVTEDVFIVPSSESDRHPIHLHFASIGLVTEL